MIFRSATHLLWGYRMSALVAAVALGASGAMLLGAMQTSASAISTVHPAQPSPRLLGPVTTVHVRAITPPASSGLPGVDTGIHLAPGEVAVITATGTASCAAGNPTGLCVYLSPNGGESATGAAPAFFDPNAPAYSLVGEAGSGPLAFIGVGTTTVQGPGELRLEYNDQLGLYFDNGGGFTVAIQACSPVRHKLRCHGLCGRSSIRAHTPCSVWWGASPLLEKHFIPNGRGVTVALSGSPRGIAEGGSGSRRPPSGCRRQFPSREGRGSAATSCLGTALAPGVCDLL